MWYLPQNISIKFWFAATQLQHTNVGHGCQRHRGIKKGPNGQMLAQIEGYAAPSKPNNMIHTIMSFDIKHTRSMYYAHGCALHCISWFWSVNVCVFSLSALCMRVCVMPTLKLLFVQWTVSQYLRLLWALRSPSTVNEASGNGQEGVNT